MLRRSTAQLFRATPIRKAGAKPHPYMGDAAGAPAADEVTGILGKPWVGEQKMLRAIDFVWIHNRVSQLGREYYIAILFFWPATYSLFWTVPNKMMWGDKTPPRNVDWNKKESGRLPEGFVKTVVSN
jgi:hypothetical protein